MTKVNHKNKLKNKNIMVDTQINADHVLIVDINKKFIEKLSLQDAIDKAKSDNQNLIQIGYNENKREAVCLIFDINKYLYSQNKNQKSQTIQKVKEIRLTAKSDLTDLLRSLEQCKLFILEKNLSVVLVLKAYRKSFAGKDKFIADYINMSGTLSFLMQKSPRPNIMKFHVVKKSNKSKE